MTRKLAARHAEAAANDGRIFAAARTTLLADPRASLRDVASAAGVGMAAIYRRYESREGLLRTLCMDGLEQYVGAGEEARQCQDDPWERFVGFVLALVNTDAANLTRRLAGTFEPTPELRALAARAGELNAELFDAAQRAGAIRSDAVVNDLALLLEQVASIDLGSSARTRALRRRYATLALDGLRAPGATRLPEAAPSDAELVARWRPGT